MVVPPHPWRPASGELILGESVSLAADGDETDRALVAGIVGTQRLFEGKFLDATASLEHGKAAVGPGALLIPQDPSLAAECQLAIALWHTGRTLAARVEIEACLASADVVDSPRADFTRAFVYSYAAWLLELIGDSERAFELADSAGRVAVERHFATWQVAAGLHMACARGALGHVGEAIEGITSLLHVWRELGGAALMVPYFLARRGWAHLASGDADAAADDAAGGLSVAASTGQGFHDAELLRLLGSAQAAAGAPPARSLATLHLAEQLARDQVAITIAGRAMLRRQALGAQLGEDEIRSIVAMLDDDPEDPTCAALVDITTGAAPTTTVRP